MKLIPQFCTGRKPELVFFLHIIVAGIVIDSRSLFKVILPLSYKNEILIDIKSGPISFF